MTCTLISSLAAGLVLMAGTASAQSWTDWGVADLRALIEAENGVVTDERREANGEITVDVKMDDWLAVSVFGFACSEGDIETIRCQGLSLAALYETDDTAKAERLQRELLRTRRPSCGEARNGILPGGSERRACRNRRPDPRRMLPAE